MTHEDKMRAAIDRQEIKTLIARSIIARDSALWDDLADCYHPDATLTSSWFTGSPAEFVKVAAEMKLTRHEGEAQMHLTGNHWIRTNGNRALAESDLILFQRRVIDGNELDFSTFSRRIDMLEKRAGTWKIWVWTLIYEKDRMDAPDPDALPDGFYGSMDLTGYPRAVRYHCWRNDRIGFPPAHNIRIKGTEREQAIRADAQRWIDGL